MIASTSDIGTTAGEIVDWVVTGATSFMVGIIDDEGTPYIPFFDALRESAPDWAIAPEILDLRIDSMTRHEERAMIERTGHSARWTSGFV